MDKKGGNNNNGLLFVVFYHFKAFSLFVVDIGNGILNISSTHFPFPPGLF